MIIGVAAGLTLAQPLTGWAADDCGLCEPGTELEFCSDHRSDSLGSLP